MHASPLAGMRCNKLRYRICRLPVQFTYINLAFAPAPDDTVANLFKVRSLHVMFSL